MGMPACRITDLTAHGGTVLEGFPEVLIGDLPAARIGDMHECPMVTPGVPPIPHVGGPFILGSPTVLVGEMPQSRVTDQLVCVGPPDEAVMGEFTVLVGMAGGAGAAAADAGVASLGVPVPRGASVAGSGPSGSSSSTAQTKATRQADGTVQTSSTVPGKPLPPLLLQQPGWPDLPPEHTATFNSVQPATVQPGAQLFAPGHPGQSTPAYWSTVPPSSDAGAEGAPNPTRTNLLTVTHPHGLKVWAGEAASGAPGLQVWADRAQAHEYARSEDIHIPPSAGGHH
jgi:uncharacterized Zn-binding protein involved in type VI secretion